MAFPTTVVFIFFAPFHTFRTRQWCQLKIQVLELTFPLYFSHCFFYCGLVRNLRKICSKYCALFTVFVYLSPFSHTMGACVPNTQFSQDFTEFILLIFNFSPILRRSIKEKGSRSKKKQCKICNRNVRFKVFWTKNIICLWMLFSLSLFGVTILNR